jgi:hypothetical protein
MIFYNGNSTLRIFLPNDHNSVMHDVIYISNIELSFKKFYIYIYIYTYIKQKEIILWRIDPLLIGDSVNSGRFWVTAR